MSVELDRLVAACIFPSFAGVRPPDWLRQWLEAGLGGVVLFSRNVESRDQLAELNRSLQAEQPDLVIAIDEEGGDVTRLEAASGSSYPGNAALGAVDDPELTEQVAAAIAGDLVAVGVNLDLAPVADINTNPSNPVIGVRAFGSEPELVARHVASFVHGLQAAGVGACAKHFPGHGDTELDSHLALPTVDADREELLAGPLVPFRAAIEAGVAAVMTAHIRVPAIDDAPATLSREIVTGLLREELGFTGLVVTDALEMAAISARVGVEEGAVRSLIAGADAICVGAALGAVTVTEVHAAIVGAIQSGRLREARIREAAARVIGTARASGERRPPVERAVGLEAARRAVRVEGDVRLTSAPLVVELEGDYSIASDVPRYRLGDALRARLPGTELVRAPLNGVSMPARPGERPLVVVVHDAHRSDPARAAVESLLAEAPAAVVVETGLPLWRPDSASGYVATYGSGRVNLDAAVEALTGVFEPSSAAGATSGE